MSGCLHRNIDKMEEKLLRESFGARDGVFSHIYLSSRFRHFEDEFKGRDYDL